MRSTVPDEDEWNRDTNFFVRRPKEVSYLVFSNGDLAVTAIDKLYMKIYQKNSTWSIRSMNRLLLTLIERGKMSKTTF